MILASLCIGHLQPGRRHGTMERLSREQKTALRDIYQRKNWTPPKSYLKFRRSVRPTIGCDGAIVLPYCNMYLLIERNGYVHS